MKKNEGRHCERGSRPAGGCGIQYKMSREKAQKAQERKSPCATFVLFRGYYVNVNPPDRLGCQAGSTRRSRCGEGGSNSVKPMLLDKLSVKSYARALS
jgi:hypothetical protein